MLETAGHRRVARALEPQALPHQKGTRDAGPIVLFVDDQRLVRVAFERTFRRRGWRVLAVNDAEMALVTLRQTAVDAVVADLRLDGMSGLELIATLRAEGIDDPAVLYTAFPEPDVQRESRELGIPCVSKGAERGMEALVGIVEDLVSACRRRREAVAERLTKLLGNLAERLVGERGWVMAKPASGSLLRRIVEPGQPFVQFLILAETLRALHSPDSRPSTASSFARLQASRCRIRCDMAHAIRLDQIAGAAERNALGWDAATLPEIVRARTTDIGLDEALRRAGWSERTIARAIVLRRAVMLVAHTPEQHAQIAYQLGFEHPASFTRFFGQCLGLAPTKFRYCLGRSEAGPRAFRILARNALSHLLRIHA